MTDTSPPPEAQRFGRSQTPESPRPVHLPEPSTIPVLLNQMDPVFNDTATYNIPHNQTFSPYSDSARVLNDPNSDEHGAFQNFLQGVEEDNVRFENGDFSRGNGQNTQDDSYTGSTIPPALSNALAHSQSSESNPNAFQTVHSQNQTTTQPGYETFSAAEIDANASASDGKSALQSSAERISEPDPAVKPNIRSDEGGIDYQSLLDTISQSASTAPPADPISAPTTFTSFVDQNAQPVPPIPGLPPKPPAQANVPQTPNYYAFSNSRSDLPEEYQPVNNDSTNANEGDPSMSGSSHPVIPAISTQFPVAWPQAASQISPRNPEPLAPGQSLPPESSTSTEPGERPWTPGTQGLYDHFLEEERRYVTEGIWDKFPAGSRLFVGNLPSEKVTKRDLFHTFHRHGRLAQISIKQAYGFVQYVEASSCQAALQAEQGVEIRGRKVHLEISKPQKNTRNQAQGNKRRRSRSPDRGNSRQNDRHARSNFNDFRDDRERRDDYRPVRSLSPRSYRVRDDYRSNGPNSPRFGPDGRTRSPPSNFPPPLPVAYDEEASIPLPRRDPRDVPDVQLLVLEPVVAQSFAAWVEQGFRAKGLRASTIWLSPRLPLNGVVKRQIIEGVQAVVKLTQGAQYNSKIPLQVFDRSSGATNVNFNEYVDLDVPVAADIVLHARQKERSTVQPPQFPAQGYAQSPYGHQLSPQFPPQVPPPFQQPQHNQFQYNQPSQYQGHPHTPVTPNSAPNLQQLLANLRQPGDQNAGANERPTQDLAGLLTNVARQQNQGVQFPQSPAAQQQQQHQQQHQQQQHQQGYGGAPAYGTGQQAPQNVQNIMETLARYNR